MKLCIFLIHIRTDRDICSAVYTRGLTMLVIHKILWSKCPKVYIIENYWLKNANGARVPVFEIYLGFAVPEKNWRRKFSLKTWYFQGTFHWKWVNKWKFFTRAFSLKTSVFENRFILMSIMRHHENNHAPGARVNERIVNSGVLCSNIRSQNLCASSIECTCRPI